MVLFALSGSISGFQARPLFSFRSAGVSHDACECTYYKVCRQVNNVNGMFEI